MLLRLSCWCEDLSKSADISCVFTVLHEHSKPTVLGKTETVTNSAPDFCETFTLEFELGADVHLVASIYSGTESLGSTLLEVGSVLAHGGVQAKELKNGRGVVAVRVEPAADVGRFDCTLRCTNLTNCDAGLGMLNVSDPFLEVQRYRSGSGWDAVYRTDTVTNSLNPLFAPASIELDVLGVSDELRIMVFDQDKRGVTEIGSLKVTIPLLLDSINDSAPVGEPYLNLKDKHGKDAGQLFVVKAVTRGVPAPPDAEPEPEVEVVVPAPPVPIVEPEISVAATPKEEEIVVAAPPPELAAVAAALDGPTFADYVAAGCQLRVSVAIDSTASNGNPREDTSLHHFNDIELNQYEQSLQAICEILSKYDSDQMYPVHGFGAKQDGSVSNCFEFGNVQGVDGILKVYRDTFRSGIVMSAPRDFAGVIAQAGKDAATELAKAQSYSILLIFTNGSPADTKQTMKALEEVDDSPLSVVIVGVGASGDFTATKALERPESGCRDKVRFVHYRPEEDHENLTKAALHHIPSQLETYFISKEMLPRETPADEEPDEVTVEPYNEATAVEAPVEVAETGEVTVTADVKPPKKEQTPMAELMKLGKDAHKHLRKLKKLKRLKKKFNKKNVRRAKGRLNKFLGTKL